MSAFTRRVLLAIAALPVAGAARAAKTPSPPPPPVIGAVAPLTGDLSLVGDEGKRGIALAVDMINSQGGIAGVPAALVTANAIDQGHAGAAVGGLINTDHANLILSAGTSALCYPASAAAELAQTPFIELTATADGITARGFKYLLRAGPTTGMIAALAVQTLQSRHAGRKLGFLFNTGATGGAIAAATLNALTAAKTPPWLTIGYAEGGSDLFEPVGRLKRAGVEIVLHAGGPSEVLAFFTAMVEQSWHPGAVLGCGDGYGLRETAYAIGPAFEGTAIIAAPYYPQDAASVKAAYVARYGMEPRAPDSLTAYVGALFTLAALNKLNGDTNKLLDFLRQSNAPPGALPNGFGVQFDHTGQNTRSFVTLQRWRHGALIPA
ncbi:MAG: ABC transporter substrate-binding protein [Acidocella sp.]|nr:ABC transporter substrate-binding protein [Acidocella sp.]